MVGRWLSIQETFGGKPGLVTVFRDVTDVRYPPLGGCMSQFVVAVRQARRLCGGPPSGKLSGGNWMVSRIDPFGVTSDGPGASSSHPNNYSGFGLPLGLGL
jgi:hypothetical protein